MLTLMWGFKGNWNCDGNTVLRNWVFSMSIRPDFESPSLTLSATASSLFMTNIWWPSSTLWWPQLRIYI